jgi:NarL family two-component system sensor histidine kinase LiaS
LGLDWQIAAFGALAAATGAVAVAAGLHAALGAAALWTALGTAAGAVLAFWLARPLKRDVRAIAIYTALLARGQYQAQLPTGATGELGYLMRQLRLMADSLVGQVQALRRLAEDRATLAQRAERVAVLEERQRLARELHDTVSQELFGLAMLLGATRQLLPQDADIARQHLLQAEEAAQRAQATMRALIRALRPVELAGQTLAQALLALQRDIEERVGVAVHVEGSVPETLPRGVEDALFRVTQEAVANAVRHGHPAHVTIRAEARDDDLVLTIVDDGSGFDPATVPEHVGIPGMRERLAEVGGRLVVWSLPGQGTRIEARIPHVVLEEGDGDADPGPDRG